jgi:hypothetical protein
MPRTRLINPEFFLHEDLGSCTAHARLLFIALWTQADREGRLRWLPLKIHGETFPHEPGLDISGLAAELARTGALTIYKVGSRDYAHITGFTKWQNPHRNESPSKHPEPPTEIEPGESLHALGQPKDNQETTSGGANTSYQLLVSDTSSALSIDKASSARQRTVVETEPPPKLKIPTGDDVLDYLLVQWGPLLGRHETLPRWLDSAREAYPGTDLLGEAKRAAAWEMSKPANKKKQVRAFLTRWWGRQQDRGGTRARDPSASNAEDDALAAARRLGATL